MAKIPQGRQGKIERTVFDSYLASPLYFPVRAIAGYGKPRNNTGKHISVPFQTLFFNNPLPKL